MTFMLKYYQYFISNIYVTVHVYMNAITIHFLIHVCASVY